MTDTPPVPPKTPDRGLMIGFAVLFAILAAGIYFGLQAASYSPEDLRHEQLLQREGSAWRKIEAQFRSTHTRQDEIDAYEGFLKQFPPGNPPTKHEAEALAALKELKSQEAPPTLPKE